MRPLGVIVAVVVGFGAISGTIWLGRYSPWAAKYERPKMRWERGTGEEQKKLQEAAAADKRKGPVAQPPEEKTIDPKPPVADKPPFPKAVTGERIHEFGTMGINEEQKHKFQITNKGEGPLVIAKGPTNCKCTISSISKKDLATGETATVEMSWTPREADPAFSKTATIYTNDPELPEIQFKVFGKVAQLYYLRPEKEWYAGLVTDVDDGKTRGTIGSEIDKTFKILKIETNDPHLKVASRRLNPLELRKDKLKSGYELSVTIDKGIPMGAYRKDVIVHTSLEGNKTINVPIAGHRSGPILFLPPVIISGSETRPYWISERQLLNLGRVSPSVGVKVALPAIIFDTKEKFQLLEAKTNDFIKVTAQPDPTIGSAERQGIRFIFEIPPGSPPVVRIRPNAAHVTLKTNHPRLAELKVEVEYIGE
jgi:Protein of unknown function (DUF1573)